ncbi:hypothetical protein [Psychromonas ossibalaenae]|uniref:hypothetical protein n=1 Tax=Psychromonas ossibalaenae TaxID=444922 RepID=UPI0003823259|nr:hypothetical protein [Psychromonas ossibalaenae]
MDNIIPFPTDPGNFQAVRQLISQVGCKAGLSAEMITHVTEEYHEYYDQLFVRENRAPELPDGLGIHQAPLEAQFKALQEQHNQQIRHACHLILGLLIKEQLSSVR